MKPSGIDWVGDIPQHWEMVKLKHLGTARNGLTYNPKDISSDGTLVLRSSNIIDGKLDFNDSVFVNTSVNGNLKVKKGDILICSRNGSRKLIGKNAIIDKDINASFGAFMMIFRTKQYNYIHKILNSDVFNYYLGTFLTSTINQLTLSNFNNMVIPYTNDIKEQERIAEYLDRKCTAIDEAISQRERLIEKLSDYNKSLIYECVTGKKEV
jgi:type I restriction enzyme S subunit